MSWHGADNGSAPARAEARRLADRLGEEFGLWASSHSDVFGDVHIRITRSGARKILAALSPHTSTQPPRVEAEDAVAAETRSARDSARPAAVGGGE